jgi:ATP-dependent Clp protease ATP-binding subunit ClpA
LKSPSASGKKKQRTTATVNEHDVAEVVGMMTGIPVSRIARAKVTGSLKWRMN